MRLVIVFHICCFCSLLLSTTFHIKQDGSGDFTTIQAGIDEAQYSTSDTILVYPGTYFENINFNSKTIAVASLYITTLQDSFINQTIIDGNQNGSVVQLGGASEDARLCGFTIQNGSGTDYFSSSDIYLLGGGIYSANSDAHIENCIIENNTAHSGGGICIYTEYPSDACVTLKGCIIRKNIALSYGGGLVVQASASVLFDNNDLSNIYDNYAGSGCDIYRASNENSQPINVVVDTFSVMQPDNYFYLDNSGSTFSCLNAKFVPIDNDLFVSPSGDNNNSGLSIEEPLKTISFAISHIKSDSISQNTIFLDEGLYLPSETGEMLPINLRDHVSIQGSGMDVTILDGEFNSNILFGWDNEVNYSLKDFTVQHSDNFSYRDHPAVILIEPAEVYLERIRIFQNRSKGYAAFEARQNRLIASHPTSLYMNNIIIEENEGMKMIAFRYINLVIMENSFIRNNLPNYYYPQTLGGGAIITVGLFEQVNEYIFRNVEVSDNINVGNDSMSALYLENTSKVSLTNCTLANNTSNNGRAIYILGYDCELDMVNTILYGEEDQAIWMDPPLVSYLPHTLNVTNSCIMNGQDAVHVLANNVLNWNEGNITSDPSWSGDESFPYNLNSSSLCINAGTPDTTGLNLPVYDLAGNLRIYQDIIDIGAYEWDGTVLTNYKFLVSDFNLTNFPNPFNPKTKISFNLSESGKVKLVIYNIKGQKIKTLADSYFETSTHSVIWNGEDDNNNSVSSGVYFYILTTSSKTFAKRMLLLK